MRQRIFEWNGFFIHLVQFPAELFGCLLPWSLLLFAFGSRAFRASIGPMKPQFVFITVVLVMGVPTVWLPPNGATRYLLPLYPFIAVVVGFVVERFAEAAPESALNTGWRRLLLTYAGLMIVVGLASRVLWKKIRSSESARRTGLAMAELKSAASARNSSFVRRMEKCPRTSQPCSMNQELPPI